MMTRALAALLVVFTPFLLVLTAARVVMSGTWFLDFEYGRAGFPTDPYGFTQAERRAYAVYPLEYMRDGLDLSHLSARTLPDGRPLFTARELGHMDDVQRVTQAVFMVHWLLLALAVLAAVSLARRPATRPALRRAAFWGGALTLGLLVGLALLGVLAWDVFFDAFHMLFFEQGTWQFARSDTLIRLFPQAFWFDAALTIAVLTAAGAALLAALGRARGGEQ